MKPFVQNLAGGVAVIAAAALIGVVHNAVRGQSIPLVQKVEVVKTANHGDGGGDSASTGRTAATGEVTALPEGAVGVEQAKAMFDTGDAFIIDARPAGPFAEGHIPAAINVPYDRLPDYYEELTASVPIDARVVVYCTGPSCDFSDQLATELKIIGYTDIVVFTGGWEHWQAAGHPEETGDGDTTGESTND